MAVINSEREFAKIQKKTHGKKYNLFFRKKEIFKKKSNRRWKYGAALLYLEFKNFFCNFKLLN